MSLTPSVENVGGLDDILGSAPESWPLPGDVAGIALPQSDLALETTRFVREITPPVVFNHCVRVFLFGRLLAQARGADAELFYLDADLDAWAALFATDATFTFPFAPPGMVTELHGREALHTHMRGFTETLDARLDGDEEAVRRWFAAGMLASVTTMLGLAEIDEPWAKTLAST